MLDFYLYPVSYAFTTFPIAAVVFTLPFLVVQYHRHGYIHKYRALLLYLFLLYLMNAFYLILLPLPSSVHNAPPAAESYVQWIPFQFLADIARETGVRLAHPSTYPLLLQERAFLQAVFNVLLTVPFGLFLRYYFRRSWLPCLLASLGLSLCFEVTQVTGIYGIFDYPYRLFDVDDLMLNTAGGMLGYLIAAWLSLHLPRIDRLDASVDLSKKRVTYTRRGLAFLFDWALLLPAAAVLAALRVPFAYVWLIAAYFIALPYATNGQTFGKWLLRVRLREAGGRPSIRALAIRYGLLYLAVGGPHVLLLATARHASVPLLGLFLAMTVFAVDAVFAIHLLRCVFNRERKLFYETRSGTAHVISMNRRDAAEAE
ncbi:VanZ family protein [Cohnella nanjingensis]|uniref:VanZ family protein n=1 Tax=Cohnella nanjingensis TaxID=1387779 RepID=A0A7X0RSG8_9BACL|nr:VanZ family protein [Cohnella nanjingensis]MBB6672673.1 VanZ family protein [Cohnella nanjingensis]